MEEFLAAKELALAWRAVRQEGQDGDEAELEMLSAAHSAADEVATMVIEDHVDNIEAFESLVEEMEIVDDVPTDEQFEELEMLSAAIETGWELINEMIPIPHAEPHTLV